MELFEDGSVSSFFSWGEKWEIKERMFVQNSICIYVQNV